MYDDQQGFLESTVTACDLWLDFISCAWAEVYPRSVPRVGSCMASDLMHPVSTMLREHVQGTSVMAYFQVYAS